MEFDTYRHFLIDIFQGGTENLSHIGIIPRGSMISLQTETNLLTGLQSKLILHQVMY